MKEKTVGDAATRKQNESKELLYITKAITKDEETVERAIKKKIELLAQIESIRKEHLSQESSINTKHLIAVDQKQQVISQKQDQVEDIRDWILAETDKLALKSKLEEQLKQQDDHFQERSDHLDRER